MKFYFIITCLLNIGSLYFIRRMWICYFINKYPSIHKYDWKKLGNEAIPVMSLAMVPIPLLGLLVTFTNLHDGRTPIFQYHRHKIIIRIRPEQPYSLQQPIHIGYVPKYLHPKNIDAFLYDYEILETYQYKPTPRLRKALLGNFHKQKEQK